MTVAFDLSAFDVITSANNQKTHQENPGTGPDDHSNDKRRDAHALPLARIIVANRLGHWL
jgi:hypothetical protein